MPLVKRVRTAGGVNVVVEANAERLFTPAGDISRWNNRLSQKVRAETKIAAPVNKRPRWSHYGKPLKQTIRASSSIKPSNGGGLAYAAIGSSAPYALYVDQGTEAFNAKILPPWRRFSPSLYEHTWKVPENAGTDAEGKAIIEFYEVGTIRVSGQRGQDFFGTGLTQGMRGLVADYKPVIQAFGAGAVRKFPQRLADYVTTDYNASNAAFRAQLEEWRSWRDSAWANEIPLGEGAALARRRAALVERYTRTQEQREARRQTRDTARRERKRRNQEAYRRRNGSVSRDEYDRKRRADRRTARNAARAADAMDRSRADALVRAYGRFGRANVIVKSFKFRGGRWYFLIKRPGGGTQEVNTAANYVDF
jgi:hypothetical protein